MKIDEDYCLVYNRPCNLRRNGTDSHASVTCIFVKDRTTINAPTTP